MHQKGKRDDVICVFLIGNKNDLAVVPMLLIAINLSRDSLAPKKTVRLAEIVGGTATGLELHSL